MFLALGAVAEDNRLRLTKDGVLESGDRVNDDGCLEDVITVDLNKGPAIFRLNSESFDTALHVIGPDGTVYENDDFGSSKESGLNIAVKIPGTFMILVTAASPSGQGPYHLTAFGYRLMPQAGGESQFDRIQLASGHVLAGKAVFGALKLDSIFGPLPLAGPKLWDLKRDSGGMVSVGLSDASQLEGWIDGDDAAVTSSGTELKVPIREIAQFTAAGHDGPPTAKLDDGTPWIAAGDTRIAGAWTGTHVDVAGAIGALSLPAAQIAAILPPDRDRLIGQVVMNDGSKLACRPQALPLKLKDFQAPVPAGVGVHVQAIQPVSGKFVLSLTSGDEFVGQFGDLKIRSQFGAFTVTGADIAAIAVDDGGITLAITMKSGERLAGQLASDTFPFVTEWNHQLMLPSALIKGAMVKP